jgi:hypothetical protein
MGMMGKVVVVDIGRRKEGDNEDGEEDLLISSEGHSDRMRNIPRTFSTYVS